MTHFIIEMTRNAMVADIFGPPIACVITTRSRPFDTQEAAEHIEKIMRKSPHVVKTRIVPE